MMDKLSELMVAHPGLFRGTPPAVASELPAGCYTLSRKSSVG